MDTSAWFAAIREADQNAGAARQWLSAHPDTPLLTTDFVVDELLTLLMSRSGQTKAAEAGTRLIAERIATIYYVTPGDFEAAWEIFRMFRDKRWSFTDCTSRVVMDRLGVETAFAFDEHFHQFGTVEVVP